MIALAGRGTLLYNLRDGFSTRLAWISPSVDLTRAFPSMFRDDPVPPLGIAAVWIAAIGVTALAGRLAGRLTRSGYSLAAVQGIAGATAAMAALSVIWRADRVQALKMDAAILLLKAQSESPGRVAVRFPPLEELRGDLVPSYLALADTTPREHAAGQPLVALFAPPVGTYRLSAELDGDGAGVVSLWLDSQSPPQWTWTLDGSRTFWSARFRIAEATGGLEVHADEAARRTVRRLTMRAVGVDLHADEAVALRVARYGPSVVFVRAGRPFLEKPGMWIPGGRSADLIVSPDPGAHPRLFVRNISKPNHVTLGIGAWQEILDLTPREERTFDLERVSSAPRSIAVHVESSAGVRPSDVNPASTDTRELGCWLEVR